MNELLLRRRIAIINSTPSLPYDAEVEYIQAQNGAYIDTGIKASSSFYIESNLIGYFNSGSYTKWPFGGRNSGGSRSVGMYINGSTGNLCYVNNGRLFTLNHYTTYPKTAKVKYGNGIFSIDDIISQYSITVFEGNQNVYLFCLNNGGTPTSSDGVKLGATYITNGEVTLDLIPVRVGTTGYMYDKVTNTLMTNNGTFAYGNDIT